MSNAAKKRLVLVVPEEICSITIPLEDYRKELKDPNLWSLAYLVPTPDKDDLLIDCVSATDEVLTFFIVCIENDAQKEAIDSSQWLKKQIQYTDAVIKYEYLEPGKTISPQKVKRTIDGYFSEQMESSEMKVEESVSAKSKIVSIFNIVTSTKSKRMAEATEYLEALIDADTIPIGLHLESNVALFSNLKSSIRMIKDQLEETLYTDKKFVVFVVHKESTMKELIAYLNSEEKFKDLLHSNIKVTTPSQVSNFYNPKLPKTLLRACIERQCNVSNDGDKYIVEVAQDSSGQYVYENIVSPEVCARLRGLWIKKDPDIKPYDIKFVADNLELNIKRVSKDIQEPIKITNKSKFIKAVLDSDSVDIDEDIRNRLLKTI